MPVLTEYATLTPEQVEAMNSNGFLSIPDFLSLAEAQEMRVVLEDLFERRAGDNEGAFGELSAHPSEDGIPNSPQILNPVNYAPALHKFKCFDRGLQIAKQLLGNDARFMLDVSILKRHQSGAPTPWHQDAAFRDPAFDYREITVWIPLQPVDENSSCLKFIPGSHLQSIRDHRSSAEGSDTIALECLNLEDEAKAVTCPLPLGGCTIHTPKTLHCSTPNHSKGVRIAYAITYGLTPIKAEVPRNSPWLESRETVTRAKKRAWMRRGGFVITAWRRLRRGDIKDFRSVFYWSVRFVKTIRKGD